MTIAPHMIHAERETLRAGNGKLLAAMFWISPDEPDWDVAQGRDSLITFDSPRAVQNADRSNVLACSRSWFVQSETRLVKTASACCGEADARRALLSGARRDLTWAAREGVPRRNLDRMYDCWSSDRSPALEDPTAAPAVVTSASSGAVRRKPLGPEGPGRAGTAVGVSVCNRASHLNMKQIPVHEEGEC